MVVEGVGGLDERHGLCYSFHSMRHPTGSAILGVATQGLARYQTGSLATSDASSVKATCAVCLRSHLMVGEKIARHGFHIVTKGFGQGHLGAWHTGPCQGPTFPDLGESTNGTVWALATIRLTIAGVRAAMEVHESKPLLWWEHVTGFGAAKKTERIEVAPGSAADYRIGRPSYDDLWKSRKRAMEADLRGLLSDEKRYAGVIETWTPEQYARVAVAPTAPVRHVQALWRNRSSMVSPKCRMYAMQPPTGSALFADAEHPATCQRCGK